MTSNVAPPSVGLYRVIARPAPIFRIDPTGYANNLPLTVLEVNCVVMVVGPEKSLPASADDFGVVVLADGVVGVLDDTYFDRLEAME